MSNVFCGIKDMLATHSTLIDQYSTKKRTAHTAKTAIMHFPRHHFKVQTINGLNDPSAVTPRRPLAYCKHQSMCQLPVCIEITAAVGEKAFVIGS